VVGGAVVHVNPGTGPVVGATVEDARANVDALLRDAGVDPTSVEVDRDPAYDDGGRFSFVVHGAVRDCEVDMPGLPLDRVRFTGAPDQDIWQFPRMYVDGGSWVWKYAVGFVSRACVPSADEREGSDDT
jgi:hypothetical protein